jgi:hypothetical protein
MDRLSTAQKIGVGGAIVLLVASFLPWYSVSLGGFGSISIKAWDAGFWAWAGVLLGVAGGVILALKAMGTRDVQAGGLGAEQIALLLGALSVVFILLRFLTESSLVGFGLFVGLVGAALVAYGAFMEMKSRGLTVDDMKRGFGGSGTTTPGGPPPPPAP